MPPRLQGTKLGTELGGFVEKLPLDLNMQEEFIEEDRIAKAIVNAAYRVHKALGPGLLERVYEACLAYELQKAGLNVRRQVDIPIVYDNLIFEEGLRLDLLVDEKVIVEIKAVDTVNPVWQAQVISHLKLTGLKVGLLINFNVVLIKDGIQRFRN